MTISELTLKISDHEPARRFDVFMGAGHRASRTFIASMGAEVVHRQTGRAKSALPMTPRLRLNTEIGPSAASAVSSTFALLGFVYLEAAMIQLR